MKRFYLMAWALVLSMPVLAKNKISMVTYFPVPYVAYSQASATGMDIGLSSTCDMKLGCAQSDVTLKATDAVNVTNGRLNLDGGLGVKGSSVVLGEGNKLGRIHFNNVRFQTGNMNSVSVENNIVTPTLNLFGQKFPSCKAKDGKGKMSWKQLTLAGADKKELYLVCGDGVESVEKPCTQSKPTDSQACGGGCGRQFRNVSCNTSTGQWETGEWSSCSGGTPAKTTEEKPCSITSNYKYHPSSDSPSGSINFYDVAGKRTRVWDAATCKWADWGPCKADIYVSMGPFTKPENKGFCQSDPICNTGPNQLNGPCTWPQSGGLGGKKCAVPYAVDGCYLYQCQTITIE